MLQKVKFKKDYRCFKEGDEIDFKPLTILVGDQRTGKSTIIELVRNCSQYKEIVQISANKIRLFSLDFEKDSSRGAERFKNELPIMFQIASAWSSHGETVNAFHQNLNGVKNSCIIQDEPDMALSIRSIMKLIERFKTHLERKNQLILSAHNPMLIGAFPEVYSMEHRKYMPSQEFVNYMLAEKPS